MRRVATLIALVTLVLPAPAAGAALSGITSDRLLDLALHRLRAPRARVPARPSLHAILRAAPERTWSRAAAAPAQRAPQPAPPAPASPALSAAERDLVAAMNRIRAQRGLRSLAASAALSKAATVHSVEMVRRGYFEHESANGEDFSVRVQRYYPRSGARQWSIGENLAYGCPSLSVDDAMDMWMKSPGHRANILHAAWTEVGVSIVHADSAPGEYDGDETTVMTVDFGVRR